MAALECCVNTDDIARTAAAIKEIFTFAPSASFCKLNRKYTAVSLNGKGNLARHGNAIILFHVFSIGNFSAAKAHFAMFFARSSFTLDDASLCILL